MATKQSLLITTTANRADVSSFPTLTGFSVVETTPDGTSTRYLVKTSDDSATWKAYDASSSTWKDVATQDITASSVMSEGMSKTALEAVPASAMTGFVGKSIDIAAAMQTTNDTQPTIQSFSIKGAVLKKAGRTITVHSSLDGYEYENFHVEDGKLVMCPPVVGVALLKTGGGNGTWAHVDEKGNVIK